MTRSPIAFALLAVALAIVPPAQAAPPRNDNYLASLRLNDETGLFESLR